MNVKGFLQQVGFIPLVLDAYRQPPFCPSSLSETVPGLFGQLGNITNGGQEGVRGWGVRRKTLRGFLTRGGQDKEEVGGRGLGGGGAVKMVNVNLNRGGNVIISKSAEPSRPGGRGRRWMATLHPERVGPRDRGHDCQSHPEDLCPPPTHTHTPNPAPDPSAKFSKHMQAHKGVED